MFYKLTQIEGDAVGDHTHLTVEDECYFCMEYTSGKDYTFGKANNLISNLKRGVEYRARPGVWRYKEQAISECAQAFQNAVNPRWLQQATLVPVPPSKAKDDPAYDDRMLRILQQIQLGFPVDIRELVKQKQSLRSSHTSDGNRVTVEELLEVYSIDETLAVPAPKVIGIFDDVITAGTHFKAMKQILRTQFPDTKIIGFFAARRIFPAFDLDELD